LAVRLNGNNELLGDEAAVAGGELEVCGGWLMSRIITGSALYFEVCLGTRGGVVDVKTDVALDPGPEIREYHATARGQQKGFRLRRGCPVRRAQGCGALQILMLQATRRPHARLRSRLACCCWFSKSSSASPEGVSGAGEINLPPAR
jgi:hypothetical protein